MEASMRRVAHYDYWEDKMRPSILSDSKADLLVYGMAELAIAALLERLSAADWQDVPAIAGTARLLGAKASAGFNVESGVLLPSWEELRQDPTRLMELTLLVEREQSPFCGKPLLQWHGNRLLVVEPPARPLAVDEMDTLAALPYTRREHPSCTAAVPALATVKDSIVVSRGCAGGCSFCGLGLHQGKFHSSRSVESVLGEVRQLRKDPAFKGTLSDLGGPTANLYAARNGHTGACRKCRRPSCLWPSMCRHFELDEAANLRLLREVRAEPGIRHVFVQSGIRMDVIRETPEYLRELLSYHVSGHLKVAPEHLDPDVLNLMRKPAGDFEPFLSDFAKASAEAGKKQYLVPYFISSFPGCSDAHMEKVERFLRSTRWNLQQVQDFIPLPMTAATALYVSGTDFEGNPIPVARNAGDRERQKRCLRPLRHPDAPSLRSWDAVD
jgi:uncharacterized radical SAM protein YgiQ